MSDYIITEVNLSNSTTSEEVTHYIKKTWSRRIALSEPWFYNWQFIESPDCMNLDRCIVVTNESGEIYGFMGLNPRDFNISGESVKGAELTTWMISEELQGKGFGRKILKYLKNKYDILIGMGISEMALRVYLPEGFKWIKAIPRYVRVFNSEKVAEFSEITELGHKLLRETSGICPVDYCAKKVDIIKDRELISSFHNDYNCFSRDYKYIEWRYINHPVYDYQMFCIESQGTSAIVILRVEQKDNYRFMHIVDILANHESMPGVISFIEEYGLQIKADFADFFCTASEITHYFWYYGWISMVDEMHIKVPHLYYPIEFRNPPTTSLIIWSRLRNSDIYDLANLYITKGDCDFDRPTIDYLVENKIKICEE